MKNLIALIFVLFNFCSVAFATEPESSGFYLGGMAGYAELDDDGLFNSIGADLDDSDTGYAIFGGYKFLRWLAVEARLSNLGSYSVGVCDFNFGCISDDIDLSAVSAHVVGIIPFGASGWELFGQLGLAAINIDCDGCDDETAGSAGLGVRFYPTANWGISLQIDAYVWEEDGFYGDTYDPSVGTTQLGVHYLF